MRRWTHGSAPLGEYRKKIPVLGECYARYRREQFHGSVQSTFTSSPRKLSHHRVLRVEKVAVKAVTGTHNVMSDCVHARSLFACEGLAQARK